MTAPFAVYRFKKGHYLGQVNCLTAAHGQALATAGFRIGYSDCVEVVDNSTGKTVQIIQLAPQPSVPHTEPSDKSLMSMGETVK